MASITVLLLKFNSLKNNLKFSPRLPIDHIHPALHGAGKLADQGQSDACADGLTGEFIF